MHAVIQNGFRISLRLRGFRRHHLDWERARLHVWDADGSGRSGTIVVLHGLSASGGEYRPFLSSLRPLCSRVVAPDMPGHGFSQPPWSGLDPHSLYEGTAFALDQTTDEPFWLIGSSMGANVAVRYANDHPERVRGLILLAPALAPMSSSELVTFLAGFRMDTMADALDFIDRLFERPSRLRRLYALGVRASMRRRPIRQLLASLRPEHLLSAEMLSALDMPVQLIWGPSDRIFPPSARAFFFDHLPAHAERYEPLGFGHCPFLDRLDDLTALVGRFVARHSGVGAALRGPSPATADPAVWTASA